MDFKKNKEKATAERKAGASMVLDRICDETGVDKNHLTWVQSLDDHEPKYRLRVSVGDYQHDFTFTHDGLSDYPTGHPGVDSKIDAIVHWIRTVRQI
ncbi:MAG: hypothetical protein IH969_07155 [Candidatus Krumholzibacteriota bacterium]|nr:hypothetical protein [Candidatus Krumholzibacteriota bacterium]